MWPLVIGAVAGSALSSVANYGATNNTNNTSIKLWREQAEYNKPVNQMARFAEAGLNPNLIYGQASSGNMASAPSLQSPRFDDLSKSFMLAASMRNMVEQNKNLQAQNSLINSQNSVALENARRQRLENNYFEKYGQWPSQEGGYVKDVKSLFNFLGDFFNIRDDMNPRKDKNVLLPVSDYDVYRVVR